MADIELSLDDIIKKRNITTRPIAKKPLENRRKPMQLFRRPSDGPRPSFVKKPVVDARYKIMNSQFRRVGSDARDRIEAMRTRNRPLRRLQGESLSRPLLGQVKSALRRPMDVDMFDEVPRERSFPLMRTINNDLPLFKRQPFDWDRPVEDDEDMEMSVDRLRRNISDPPGFRPGAPDWDHISITLKNPRPSHGILASVPHPGILKKPPAAIVSPPVVPARSGTSLSERFNRDRNAEAAVKVEALKAQLKAAKGETETKSEFGHRIVVSNLVPSVTHEDVKELFADIGELQSSKLVRPGVAEVVYHQYEDAAKAVDVYHNRQLDGQPMKCLLVNRLPKKSKQIVELDMVTLRNALHKKMQS